MSKDNEFDQRILEILRMDSRKSFVNIGKELGVSESAIRRRIKNLIDDGSISRFTIEENADKKTSAITLLSVGSTTDTNSVASKLQSITAVKVIYEITGQYDIAVIISANSINEINRSIDDIRRIEGVSDTDTVIILRTLT
ncbi:MAG TPA: Lrp/AsnC family transcriptional regulator [Nitrososphaeraceae archaeon]|jgi:Lrp/AsnC family transcriptional regulator for asnA, asnC and gidA|nr:Lrp/AsnC family transcriptional regulator [Nitrososphaeraceae archaeon]